MVSKVMPNVQKGNIGKDIEEIKKNFTETYSVQIGVNVYDVNHIMRGSCRLPLIIKDIIFIDDWTSKDFEVPSKRITILSIFEHNGTMEERAEAISKLISNFRDSDNCIVITNAYVSKYDYPESEYYNPFISNEVDKIKAQQDGKKEVPIKEELEKQSKMLESIGFVRFDFFTQYEYQIAYILNNPIGKKVVSNAKKLLESNSKR